EVLLAVSHAVSGEYLGLSQAFHLDGVVARNDTRARFRGGGEAVASNAGLHTVEGFAFTQGFCSCRDSIQSGLQSSIGGKTLLFFSGARLQRRKGGVFRGAQLLEQSVERQP